MRRACQVLGLIAAVGTASGAQGPQQGPPLTPAETLLEPAILRALDTELSGARARDHVQRLTEFHRVPASPGFHDAVQYIRDQAAQFGLADVRVERFAGDGKTYFGTLLGNRGWRVNTGELSEITPRARRITSTTDVALAVADNSESADVTAALVDVGTGTTAAEYQGREVRGKLVLADGNPGAVHALAVAQHGALGIISYNSNQQTGWWRDDPDLVRWGHLDAQGRTNTFALMISLREARELQRRLGAGEIITLQAKVDAANDDQSPYETLMATIPGSDPGAGEIVFSCHLDHQKPGANDNASGCSAILEIGRALNSLIQSKAVARPARTIRFVWPSEMTGTIAYLTKYPEIAGRIKAAVHLDMVGGDPLVTKSILHVTRSPWSVASITDEVAEIFARYVIDGAYEGASTGDASKAVRSPGGSKDAFWADITPYESGSDHWIYQEGAFAIPTVYLRDWPDVYIHTTGDRVDNIEPTKLKRSAFIAAATGYFLATFPNSGAEALLSHLTVGAHARLAEDARRVVAQMGMGQRPSGDVLNTIAQSIEREQRRIRSVARFVPSPIDPTFQARLKQMEKGITGVWASLGISGAPFTPTAQRIRGRGGEDRRVPTRVKDIKGPLDPGNDWVVEKAGNAARQLALLKTRNGEDVAYEIVNFIDGARSISDIRDAVSAEFGNVPLAAVVEYLELLARIGAVTLK
jgi:aminopeptidase YwaD